MLIGIELRGQSVLMDQVIVIGHLRVADYRFVTMILFGDDPNVGRTGHVLRVDEAGEDEEREHRDK